MVLVRIVHPEVKSRKKNVVCKVDVKQLIDARNVAQQHNTLMITSRGPTEFQKSWISIQTYDSWSWGGGEKLVAPCYPLYTTWHRVKLKLKPIPPQILARQKNGPKNISLCGGIVEIKSFYLKFSQNETFLAGINETVCKRKHCSSLWGCHHMVKRVGGGIKLWGYFSSLEECKLIRLVKFCFYLNKFALKFVDHLKLNKKIWILTLLNEKPVQEAWILKISQCEKNISLKYYTVRLPCTPWNLIIFLFQNHFYCTISHATCFYVILY